MNMILRQRGNPPVFDQLVQAVLRAVDDGVRNTGELCDLDAVAVIGCAGDNLAQEDEFSVLFFAVML